MAKREPLFEADLGDNGGLMRLWNKDDVERFIAEERSFWQVIHNGDMNQPFAVVNQRLTHLASSLRHLASETDREAGSNILREIFGNPETSIPLSTSKRGEALIHIRETLGRDAARGALGITLPRGLWSEQLRPATNPIWRGMIEQVIYESGVTPQSVEAAKRTFNGLNGRASQVLAAIDDRANELHEAAKIDFGRIFEHQEGRFAQQEEEARQGLARLTNHGEEWVAKLEATHQAYLEQMKLKAPVEYWREKASNHRTSARELRNWVAGFFALMIGGYVIAFAGLHQQFAAFLLQFQGSTGALLVVSAVFALLASLPLWIGRLLVKFYLSEHHLATDAKERETMTQTYLALTAEGAVDEKDRALILGALFRSTPDGVVRDNAQPDTSPAAMLSKLLDSR